MRRRRKVRLPDEESTNRWVISYADFITLLFAFFVVMYAVSSVNLMKYRKVTKSVSQAFSGKPPVKKGSHLPDEVNTSLKVLQDKLIQRLQQDKLEGLEISGMGKGQDWVEMTLKGANNFETGQASLTTSAKQSLETIANLIRDKHYYVVVEGYTDNIPIKSDKFPSNWALSAVRAAVVADELALKGIDPDRISAIGFGESHPQADNGTMSGRAKNRRVVIIIATDRGAKRLLNPQLSRTVLEASNTTTRKPALSERSPGKLEEKIGNIGAIRTKKGNLLFTRLPKETGEKQGEEP